MFFLITKFLFPLLTKRVRNKTEMIHYFLVRFVLSLSLSTSPSPHPLIFIENLLRLFVCLSSSRHTFSASLLILTEEKDQLLMTVVHCEKQLNSKFVSTKFSLWTSKSHFIENLFANLLLVNLWKFNLRQLDLRWKLILHSYSAKDSLNKNEVGGSE